MHLFNQLESRVRGYCRSFPVVFTTARGDVIIDEQGREYLDFFAGAGALNYGHNPPQLKAALLEYLINDGITHGLDMATTAKRQLLETLDRLILKPRGLDYKLMFPGPTGTNAVEAALKLARKVTQRESVISFTNGFHGMTLGSLALTGNASKRAGAGVPLNHVTHMPYCGYFDGEIDSISMVEQFLVDASSGVDLPAAFILETVQAEGGVNVASADWLQRLTRLAKRFEILMIIDDIQVGCGRTGSFFSFEPYGLEPDLICLSKSLSGYGLPLSIVLIKPELDRWEPGEHNGTFRGHNPAFVTATTALQTFWSDSGLGQEVKRKAAFMRDHLLEIANEFDGELSGRGMIQGLRFTDPAMAQRVAKKAFENGLIIETCGSQDEVLKLLPPLTISDDHLNQGLGILTDSVHTMMNKKPVAAL